MQYKSRTRAIVMSCVEQADRDFVLEGLRSKHRNTIKKWELTGPCGSVELASNEENNKVKRKRYLKIIDCFEKQRRAINEPILFSKRVVKRITLRYLHSLRAKVPDVLEMSSQSIFEQISFTLA